MQNYSDNIAETKNVDEPLNRTLSYKSNDAIRFEFWAIFLRIPWILMRVPRALSVYSGNGKLASWAAIVGFLVMMSLDVGLS